MISKKQRQNKRKQRVRKKVVGTSSRPRLAVYRSNKHIYAQVIDDTKGETIVGVSTKKVGATGTKSEQALELGKNIGKAASDKGIKQVVFDRASYQYHGRVEKVAEGAREAGLEF